MKKALISVSDKTNIVSFSKVFLCLGFEIISTGGTYKTLKEAGLCVTKLEEYTDFKEILDGRVKTLHPKIHGGILAKRDNLDHKKELEVNNIDTIDLVCVNLYPFKETINKENSSLSDAIENIDIGGNTLLRASAKNYKYVTVVVDKDDYDLVINEFKENGDTCLETRFQLAAKVFRFCASYDAMIAQYLTEKNGLLFPEKLTLTYDLQEVLRYGENPHQRAAYYVNDDKGYKQLHGKPLSYNNLQDTNAALQVVREFNETVVVALKHTNPCAVAIGKNVHEAFLKAYAGDPVSIFGGIIATNEVVDEMVAVEMSKLFLEVIIAPNFTEEAKAILMKKVNLRLLEVKNPKDKLNKQVVSLQTGLLVQEADTTLMSEEINFPTVRKPTDKEMEQLVLGYKVVKHVKSNAIVLFKDNMTVGIGAGQMNRVGAAEIAINQAKEKAIGAIMASDAFFPMKDTVMLAKNAGVTAIIQPGGSIKDQESIDLCDEHNIAMVFTHMRHFKH